MANKRNLSLNDSAEQQINKIRKTTSTTQIYIDYTINEEQNITENIQKSVKNNTFTIITARKLKKGILSKIPENDMEKALNKTNWENEIIPSPTKKH